MRPYYQDASVTIYHGDCRDVLPTLGAIADLAITDPPYQSLDVQVGRGTTTRLVRLDALGGKRLASKERGRWFATLGADELHAIFAELTRILKPTGALYVFGDVKSGLQMFPQLQPANVIVWDKRSIGMGYNWRRMHEWIAYCPREDHTLRDKGAGDIIRADTLSEKIHATEKPAEVLQRLVLNSSDEGDLVLDPFAGSGSTLFAAKNLGRKAVGVELEERNCEVAANRCRQEVLDFGGAA